MTALLCIYHASCADGLGAAWAAHRALTPGVEFHAARYGDVLPPLSMYSMRDVLIVDFSYPLATLRTMAEHARSVLVIDHHKTARDDLAELLPPAHDFYSWRNYLLVRQSNGNGVGRNLAAIFDMERSGAGLTWDYLNPLTRDPTSPFAPTETSQREFGGRSNRPRIIDLIEDRDLWRFRHEDSRAFHAVLMSHDITDLPAMFERLDEWHEDSDHHRGPGHLAQELDEGRAILRAEAQLIARIVRDTRRTMRIAGQVVPVACVPAALASEAGHLLCQPVHVGAQSVPEMTVEQKARREAPTFHIHLPPFSASYYDGADGRRHFSLRSPGGGADVGEVARRMAEQFNRYAEAIRQSDARHDLSLIFPSRIFVGPWAGGGHEHAAGFDAPLGWEGE